MKGLTYKALAWMNRRTPTEAFAIITIICAIVSVGVVALVKWIAETYWL